MTGRRLGGLRRRLERGLLAALFGLMALAADWAVGARVKRRR
jgi:hypothetical protein